MERLLEVVRWAWVLTVWMYFVFLMLFALAAFVGWLWPCEWDWGPLGAYISDCADALD